MPFRRPARFSMWIAGACICLLATLGFVAIARTIPASYANIPGEDARSKHRTAPARAEDALAHSALAPISVNRPNRASCPECGVIESMRQIERSSDGGPITVSAATAKVYEFTVRFRDGSTTVFSEAGPRAWRLGNRVMVIGHSDTK